MAEQEKITIIRDSREKEGWYWNENDWCAGYEVKALKTGDYSVVGFEEQVCIERKRSTGELAKNITEKRFVKELERMSLIPYKFIICEFDFEDVLNFPINSTIPKEVWPYLKTSPKLMLSRLTTYSVKYGIHVLYCGSGVNAWSMTNSIFKKVAHGY